MRLVSLLIIVLVLTGCATRHERICNNLWREYTALAIREQTATGDTKMNVSSQLVVVDTLINSNGCLTVR